MRLSEGEKESLISAAYTYAVELAVEKDFEIDGVLFMIYKEKRLADLVADAVTEKFRNNILWALEKDE
jgi:hypothetical protein